MNPDPRFFYGSSGHKRAFSYLRYGIQQGEGFIAVTGDVGTGKTTLIYTLLEELAKQENIVVANLITTQHEANDLLAMVAAAFGIEHVGLSKPILLQQLQRYLIDRAREEKRALLIVDEAQSLSLEGLEVLRMLTNFQMKHKALIQGFLVGQPEFRSMLQKERLEQLRQRIIASYHLGPMKPDETRQYIDHRMRVVGWSGDPAFTPDAYLSINDYSGGVPRRINKLCDRILLVGYLEEAHTITQELVKNVIRELEEESLDAPRNSNNASDRSTSPSQIIVNQEPTNEQRFSEIEERLRSTEKAVIKLITMLKFR